MISISTHIPTSPLRAVWKGSLASLQRACERFVEAQSRRDRIEMLEAKSDQELARLGIRREDIVYHVFRDRFYA